MTESMLKEESVGKFVIDGVPCVKVTIYRKKGARGKMAAVWHGDMTGACLMAFQLGIVIRDDNVKWYAVIERNDGKKYILPYGDMLKAYREAKKVEAIA